MSTQSIEMKVLENMPTSIRTRIPSSNGSYSQNVSSSPHYTTDISPDLTKCHYEPISSAQKLSLLLLRSYRYSYRQRYCKCIPTIFCELLLPIILLSSLILIRWSMGGLQIKSDSNDTDIVINPFGGPGCSGKLNISPALSNSLLTRCFKFPPSYESSNSNPSVSLPSSHDVSNTTNLIFQPNTSAVNELVDLARQHLITINCLNTKVRTQNPNEDEDNQLLQNTTENNIIIIFDSPSSLKTDRTLAYDMFVRMPLGPSKKNDPVDMSFLSYEYPTQISDRSNSTPKYSEERFDLPEFSDVKIFIDSLLISFQTNNNVKLELERNLISCTPYRMDAIYSSGSIFVNMVLGFIDIIFLIPFIILLVSLIQEKNNKEKEILKIIGIEPVLNNIAHALRTFIMVFLLIILLCVVCKIKIASDAYFKYVNFGILFLGYIVFSLQLIAFCIMNAQVFEITVRALLATFFIYGVSFGLHIWAIFWPVGVQYILIFFSPFLAAHSLFQQAVLHDIAKKDVALFQTLYRNVPMYFPTLIIMLLSCVFYWILAWYLEKVFPGQYGIPMDWNFVFKKLYWRPKIVDNSNLSYPNNTAAPKDNQTSDFELVATQNRAVVRVKHLRKTFSPDKIAVNDVSFDLYENQITSLLGPNGSGKTTVFNCLIGMYKQTSGTVSIFTENGVDYDTQDNMDLLRKSIGYCPQHDILFDQFTVEEQIQFYATARGFNRNKQAIVSEMLRVIGLKNEGHLYCYALSGGMKRRLSLACAFVGNTKIVLLDEPSSGLDPDTRRSLWEWLRTMKEGKTLLLTTHFMEEADALSDRIIILADGNIKVDGTARELKEEYGSGYKFIIVKESSCRSKDIKKELQRYLPQLTIEKDTSGSDIVIRTNQQPNNQFVSALRKLEEMKEAKLIRTYGVQNSTMDDVFLKITRDVKSEGQSETTAIDIERTDELCCYVFDDRQFESGFKFYWSQFYGLVIKTLRIRYRRWALAAIILLLPIIYNLLSNLIVQSQQNAAIFEMKLNALNPQTIVYQAEPAMENFLRAALDSKSKLIKGPGNTLSEMHENIRQQRIQRPYTYTDIYLGVHISEPTGNTFKIQALTSNLISSYELLSLASDTFFKRAINDTNANIQTTLAYRKTGNYSLQQPSAGGILSSLDVASCSLKFLPPSLLLEVFLYYIFFFYATVFLINERKDSFLSLLNISGLHPALYWLFNYTFDILSAVIWFCYLLAIYCIVDVSFNGTPSSRPIMLLSLATFSEPFRLRTQFYPLTILIALPTLPFVYLLTKVFRNDILGGLAICFLLVILHFVSLITPVLAMIVSNKLVINILYWVFNIICPSINAQVIVSYLLAQASQFCRGMNSDTLKMSDEGSTLNNQIGNDTIWANILVLFLHIVGILLLLIMYDSGFLQFSWACSSKKSSTDERELDDDVAAERNQILNNMNLSSARNSIGPDRDVNRLDHLIVHDLVKSYPLHRAAAVDHLTFGARRGEAFGLLGYNGAGKTTTFRIVVGDLMATEGTAYIDGQNIRRRLTSIRRLGYCPQQDCSMDFLTVRDSFYLLARIRGVSRKRIDSMVSYMITLFLLESFDNNYIHQLSGGTKRRLHAALALIGPPLVAILDEPTTGVDPNARQQMQKVFLNAVKAQMTIILTSHSMDECERVCNRLGIMKSGQLTCLGTIQHLKSKFGRGYMVSIQVQSIANDSNASNMHSVLSFLRDQNQFQIEVKEILKTTGQFQILESTPAELFELLEQNKERLNIETYTISQTTLEQIFLSLGKTNSTNDS